MANTGVRISCGLCGLVALMGAPFSSITGQISGVRTSTPLRIDGRDLDDVWRRTERRRDFRMFAPHEDAEPTFRTEVSVAYDDRALYVFVRAFDPRPDSVVRLLSRRDTHGAPNDEIQLFIDSFSDRRSGYEYIVNAAGVKADYILFDDAGFDLSWDGVWDVATHLDSLGWSAEYAIPLQQLRFSDREAPTFGFMVWRLVGRTGERVSWPPFRPSRSGYISQTGALHGMRSLARPASLELSPYTLLRTRNAASLSQRRAALSTNVAVGGDVKYLPKPNVSVDAAINPDFGQVDSDPAVLDLSGFEVLHAERRPFFLEGAGQLNLPLATDGSALFFHSRRIGRTPALGAVLGGIDSPTQTTILGAVRLTSRVTRHTSLALLSAVTGLEEGARRPSGGHFVVEPRAHYGVGRLQREFRGGRSGIGVMLTRVDRAADDSATASVIPSLAQAVALTTQHQTSDGNYRLGGWLAASEVQGSSDAMRALQLSTVHGFQSPDDGVHFDSARVALRGAAAQVVAGKIAGGITRFDASYRWLSPGFDVNEMGFLTTSGRRSTTGSSTLRAIRPGRALGVPYRSASVSLVMDGHWATSGLSLGRSVALSGTLQLHNQVSLRGVLSQQLGAAYCTMTCTRGGPGLVDPPRSFASFDINGDPRRRLISHLNLNWFRDDEGRSHGIGGQVDALWRARSNLELMLAVSASTPRFDAFYYRRIGALGADTARLIFAQLDQPVRSLTTRLNYTVTRALSVQWYAQAYLSHGDYSNLRLLVDPRASTYDDRFRPFADSGSAVGLAYRQFRSNAVVRWEYRPGSTLFLVWTQGRDMSAPSNETLRVGSDFRDLMAVRPRNVVALKLSYWLSR